MNDDLESGLFARDEIVPSSGFAARVMDAVREEASAPAAIPFPWKQALPGMLAVLCAILMLGYAIVSSLRSNSLSLPAPAWRTGLFGFSLDAGVHSSGMWLLLVLVLTLACVKLARLLVAESV